MQNIYHQDKVGRNDPAPQKVAKIVAKNDTQVS